MVTRPLPKQVNSNNCRRLYQNESKVLSSKPISGPTWLSRNRRRQTITELHHWTLFFANKNALLHSNEQSTNYQR